MDKTLELKIKQFKKALDRLDESIKKEQDEFMRDSVIKRFEFCFELCWKTAKLFLSQKYGDKAFSPKDCFRTIGKNQLLQENQIEQLLKMTDDRNLIVHNYSEEFSQKIAQNIINEYYALINNVYEVITNYEPNT